MFIKFLNAYAGISNSTLLKSKVCEAKLGAHCTNSLNSHLAYFVYKMFKDSL